MAQYHIIPFLKMQAFIHTKIIHFYPVLFTVQNNPQMCYKKQILYDILSCRIWLICLIILLLIFEKLDIFGAVLLIDLEGIHGILYRPVHLDLEFLL